MNCRAGDLALIVPPAYSKDCGKTVRCIRLVGDVVQAGRFQHNVGPVWEVDRNVTWSRVGGKDIEMPYCADRVLMPIRPPGIADSDETPDRIDREVTA